MKGTVYMKSTNLRILFTLAILCALTLTGSVKAQERVKIANGTLEGTLEKASGVQSFKAIPFAQPPTGDLRWKPPKTS